MIKRFKRFLKEEAVKAGFDDFVESCLEKNIIDTKAANDFIAPDYNYSGICYKVIFLPTAEVAKYDKENDFDSKGCADAISKYFNPNRYVFFCKSLQSLENQIKYPGLFNLNEHLTGVIYSIKPKQAIDLTKYDGTHPKVQERLEQTQEVLSFEDLTINKIDGIYFFGEVGWQMITDLDGVDFGDAINPIDDEGDLNDVSGSGGTGVTGNKGGDLEAKEAPTEKTAKSVAKEKLA